MTDPRDGPNSATRYLIVRCAGQCFMPVFRAPKARFLQALMRMCRERERERDSLHLLQVIRRSGAVCWNGMTSITGCCPGDATTTASGSKEKMICQAPHWTCHWTSSCTMSWSARYAEFCTTCCCRRAALNSFDSVCCHFLLSDSIAMIQVPVMGRYLTSLLEARL